MATFGGLVRFTYAGNPLVLRGHVTINPTSVKAEALPNQDGSISRMLQPWGYRVELKFEDSTSGTGGAVSSPIPQPWDNIVQGGPYNVTITEQTTHVTHLFTSAFFIGEAKVNRENGEVDGLSMVVPTGNYQVMSS